MNKPEILVHIPATDDYLEVVFYVNNTCYVYFRSSFIDPDGTELLGWDLHEGNLRVWGLQEESRLGNIGDIKRAPPHFYGIVARAEAERILMSEEL